MTTWRKNLLNLPSKVLIGLATLITVQDYLFELAPVNGPSMVPTISPTFHETGTRDIVLLIKRHHDPETRNLQRGQIVGFRPPHDPEKISIKRIVAVEGDTVFTKPRHAPSRRYPERKVVIPKGHVWVEGDNWRMTRDSNDYGPVCKTSPNDAVTSSMQIIMPVFPHTRAAQ
jgi:mitochondrial inner membrane protease subunit 2